MRIEDNPPSSPLSRRDALVLAAGGICTLIHRPATAQSSGALREIAASDIATVATGIRGPEGTSLLSDGGVAMVEFMVGDVIAVDLQGRRRVLASPGAGVVGTALGTDGALYAVKLDPEKFHPSGPPPPRPAGSPSPAPSPGGLFRIDLATQQCQALYTTFHGTELNGPDDIVVDSRGDLWFADVVDRCVYWAQSNGHALRRVAEDLDGVNGICLSPDHRSVYVVGNGKLLEFTMSGRGELKSRRGKATPRVLATLPAGRAPDGMRTEAGGNIVCGCWEDGIRVFSPQGEPVEQVRVPGFRVINMCFGGADLRTLYLAALPAAGMSGMLLSIPWPRSGMRLPL